MYLTKERSTISCDAHTIKDHMVNNISGRTSSTPSMKSVSVPTRELRSPHMNI